MFRRATKLCAVVGSGALIAAGVVGASPASAAACSATRSTNLALSAAGEAYHYLVVIHDTSHITKGRPLYTRRPVNVGGPTVSVTTCKSPTTHRWTTLTASFTNHFYDLTVEESQSSVTVKPRSGSYGWGVFAHRVTNAGVDVVVTRCLTTPAKPSVLGVAHGLLGLPLPIKTVYAVGAWVLDKALPEAPAGQYHCGQMSGGRVGFVISQSTGQVRLTGTVSAVSEQTSGETCPGAQACYWAWDNAVTVT